MKEDNPNLMDLNKLSFDDLKKIDEIKNKSCRSKDFQPFLEYSDWRHFEDVVIKVLKICKLVRHYRETHLKEIHHLTLGVQGQIEHLISKSIVDLKSGRGSFLPPYRWFIPIKGSKKAVLLKDSRYGLFIHRKKYSAFSCCQGCHHQSGFIDKL